ncbi:MAG: hypothetical protein HYV92_14230 [Candidatus Rokubacteria bacterium]|nr:hypothetical protein [Candidatus Rokubacteria bacterium]MBI2555543.1 hypothetical protein [Candidatus Rokubacteria bacterium]
MRKSVLVALLVIFAPGIAFAVFELFVFKGPVAERSRLMAWVFLLIAVACVVALLILVARDALRRGRGRGAGAG